MSSHGSDKDAASVEAQAVKDEKMTATAAVAAVKMGAKGTDVAARILAENEGVDDTWTAEDDKRLVRKMDWTLIPILFICCLWSGLDKATLSTGALYGLREDNNLTGDDYSLIGSAPYFGGLAFMPIHAILLQKLPVVRYFAFNVLVWGILEMCMAGCSSFAGLFVTRFFLGGAEALLIPVVTFIVAMWYRPEEAPHRNSLIINVFAPILNGFISWLAGYGDGGALSPWQIIFLAVGAFNVCFAFVVWGLLPNNPLEAPRFTSKEKYMIVKRKMRDNDVATGMESRDFKRDHIVEALCDTKTWLLAAAIISLQIPNGGLTVFNGLFIQGLGFTGQQSSLLSMPTGFMSSASAFVISYAASKTRRYRTPLIAGVALIPLLGALMMWQIPRDNVAGQVIGLYLSYVYWGVYATLISVYQANVAGHTKKVFLYALYYLFWAAGNCIGPNTFQSDQAPEYVGGTIALIVVLLAALAFILLYGYLCHRENMRRDRTPTDKSPEDTAWLDLTDKQMPAFRYTT